MDLGISLIPRNEAASGQSSMAGQDPTALTPEQLMNMQLRKCILNFDPKMCPLDFAMLDYRPSVVGNVIYLICFFLILGGQLFFGIRKKTYKYCAVVSLGVIGEIVGYIGRVKLYYNPYSMDNFLTNLVPLTIAPALFTGGIYLCLSRVITAIGAENSRIGPKMYTYIFVGADLFSLILQALGGGMASTANKDDGRDLGVRIMIAGLVCQVISMTIFFAIWGDFVNRTRKSKANGTLARIEPPLYSHLRNDGTMKWFQLSLFVATLLIYIRSIYRVAELWDGFESHLANDEPTFMIFEGPMIIIAGACMTMFHPGRVFGDLWDAAGKGVRSLEKGDDSYNLGAENLRGQV